MAALIADQPNAAPALRIPDYTVGLRLDVDERTGSFYLSGLVRVRIAPGAVEQLVAATAEHDGKSVRIIIEQERAQTVDGPSIPTYKKKAAARCPGSTRERG